MNGVLQIQTQVHAGTERGDAAANGSARFDPSQPSRLSTSASRRIAARRPVRAWAVAGALAAGTLIGGAISFAAMQSSPTQVVVDTPSR